MTIEDVFKLQEVTHFEKNKESLVNIFTLSSSVNVSEELLTQCESVDKFIDMLEEEFIKNIKTMLNETRNKLKE